jgi:hypothetical protein
VASDSWRRERGGARRRRGSTDAFIYLPIEQRPFILGACIIARGHANGPELLKTLRAAIAAAQPDAEVPRARTMKEGIDDALYPTRLGATVLALSGLFGLLLSAVGLYGSVSYSAAQRIREIGIRSALGAERRDLVVLLLRDAALALAVAVGVGVPLGLAAVRIVSSIVLPLARPDVVKSIAIPLLLSTMILAACLRPSGAPRASTLSTSSASSNGVFVTQAFRPFPPARAARLLVFVSFRSRTTASRPFRARGTGSCSVLPGRMGRRAPAGPPPIGLSARPAGLDTLDD